MPRSPVPVPEGGGSSGSRNIGGGLQDNPYLSATLAQSLRITPPGSTATTPKGDTATATAIDIDRDHQLPRSPVRPDGLETADAPGEADSSALNMDLSTVPREYLEVGDIMLDWTRY